MFNQLLHASFLIVASVSLHISYDHGFSHKSHFHLVTLCFPRNVFLSLPHKWIVPRLPFIWWCFCSAVSTREGVPVCTCMSVLVFWVIRAWCEWRTVHLWVWWAGDNRPPGDAERWGPFHTTTSVVEPLHHSFPAVPSSASEKCCICCHLLVVFVSDTVMLIVICLFRGSTGCQLICPRGGLWRDSAGKWLLTLSRKCYIPPQVNCSETQLSLFFTLRWKKITSMRYRQGRLQTKASVLEPCMTTRPVSGFLFLSHSNHLANLKSVNYFCGYRIAGNISF